MIKLDFQAVIDKDNKNLQLANADFPEGTYKVHLELTPVEVDSNSITQKRQPGFAKGFLIYMDKNFNEPLGDFQEYM